MWQEARTAACAVLFALGCGPLWAQGQDAETVCGTDRATLADQGAPIDMLFGRDDRQLMDSSRAPWRAIGQLVGPSSSCTGTLVDDSLVLTAAHCVTDYHSGQAAPSDVRFYAGLQAGRYQAMATATEIVVAPGYTARARPDGDVRDDWAFVVLDQPIGAATGTIPVYALRSDDLYYLAQNSWGRVDQAGYSSDRPEGLTGHLDCRIENYHTAGWVEHNCDTVPGDSGSPLIVERDRRHYVVAVASGVRCRRNGTSVYNTAPDARVFYETFRSLAHGGRIVEPGTVTGQSTRAPTSGPRIIRICETVGC